MNKPGLSRFSSLHFGADSGPRSEFPKLPLRPSEAKPRQVEPLSFTPHPAYVLLGGSAPPRLRSARTRRGWGGSLSTGTRPRCAVEELPTTPAKSFRVPPLHVSTAMGQIATPATSRIPPPDSCDRGGDRRPRAHACRGRASWHPMGSKTRRGPLPSSGLGAPASLVAPPGHFGNWAEPRRCVRDARATSECTATEIASEIASAVRQ